MNQSKIGCCAPCWNGKRKAAAIHTILGFLTLQQCQRADTGRCRSCIHHLRERKIYNQSSIKHASLLYKPAIHEELFKNAPIGSLPSLGTTGGDSNTLSFHITPSVGPAIHFSQQISGPYKTHNEVVMARLDGLGREFSADLKARNEDSQLISKSTLAGGFIHLLCSLVTVTEAATTSRNGWEVENEYTAYNIAAHFKYILICRLQELVAEILNIFRFEDQGLELPHCHSDAYAAGVILRCEVEYFQNSIKNGHLRKHIPHGVRSLLSRWFAAIECELEDRLRLGCARFASWRVSSIEGSMKSLRRHGETLNIDMHLQLNHGPEQEWPPPILVPSPYSSMGHGRDTLVRDAFLSRPNSAMRNGSQPLIIAESMASSGHPRMLQEVFQATPFFGIDPAWENPAGFLTPEFRLLGNEQATTDQTIDPPYLSLRDCIPGNKTIYETLN